MIFAALKEAADRGELILVQDGLCRWHRRRDGVVVIHEILVLPFRYKTGIGRGLLAEVAERNPKATIRARCPASYESNRWWEAMGFRLVATANEVNVWERSLSSTARTGMPLTLVQP